MTKVEDAIPVYIRLCHMKIGSKKGDEQGIENIIEELVENLPSLSQIRLTHPHVGSTWTSEPLNLRYLALR